MKEYMRMIQKAAACTIGAAALLLASCEKSEEITDNYLPSGDEQCVLLPPSISVEPFGGGSVFTRAASAIKEERQQFNVGEELGNIVTLGNGETESVPQTRADIAAGVFYRIVVYTAAEFSGSMKITEQRLCKAGSTTYFDDAGDVTTPIYLNYGSYKIFCYSFNKPTTDKMGKLADGDLNIALTDGDDFMSTIIDKTIAASDLGKNVNLGPITLYHRCCKLTGSLTAEGFDDNTITGTPSLSISGTFTQTGNWSINGSTFAVGTTANITRTFSLSGSGASRAGSVIMLPFTNKALKATYSFKPSSSKTTLSATNDSLSSGTTFDSGGNYTLTVKGLGAYVITEGVESITIAGDTWATRNVRWNNTFETNLDIWNSGNLRGAWQGTTATPTTGSDYNSYFNWGKKRPSADESYESGDNWQSSNNPCPSGYTVPSNVQLTNLVTKKMPQNKRVSINGEVIAINNAYGFYNGRKARGLVLLDGDNVLFLPAAGYRRGNRWFDIGSYGNYWGITSKGKNAYYIYFSISSGNVTGVNRNNAHSVRCVK